MPATQFVDISSTAANDVTVQLNNATTIPVTLAHSTALDSERYGLFIHPHWQKYRDVIDSAPDALIYGLGVYITLVCFVGIAGNAVAMFIFSR